MRRLYQGVGHGDNGPKQQRMTGTDTFCTIIFFDIPLDRYKGMSYVRMVCEVRPQKKDPNRM